MRLLSRKSREDAPFKGYFCPRPFEFATVNDKGEIYLCCPGWLKIAAGSMDRVTFEEVWNSKYAQKMRASILDGTFAYCNDNCPYTKTRTGILKRNEDVTDPWHKEIIEKGLTRLERGPREITVSHDPTCNLTCPSCRRGMFKHDAESRARSTRIHEQVFSQAVKDAELIEICGNGDPFASPLYLDALRTFDAERFPDLKIGLVTNGLRLDAKMWDSIAACHGAIRRIHISWNGARPETFAANQRGGRLETLLQNMPFIAELRASGAIPFMSFGFYVQRNNYREMPEMLPFARQFNADAIYFTPVSKSIAHTDAEFADHAVHRPGHEEFEAFREVLNSPGMNDPLVHLINLEHLLYHERPGDTAVPSPASSFGDLAENIDGPFDAAAFCRLLCCAPEQETPVRRFLNRLKDLSVLILDQRPDNGDPSPLDWLRAARRARDDEALADAFREYAKAHTLPDANTDYWTAIQLAARERFPEIYRSLTVVQRRLWEQVNLHTLLDVDTGYDPLAAILQYRDGGGDGQPTWVVVQQVLDLEDAQASPLFEAVAELQEAYRKIIEQPTADGGASPLDMLCAAMRTAPHTATETFARHLEAHRPEGASRSYAHSLAVLLEEATAAIEGMLAPAQREKLRTLGTVHWHELDIGVDGVGQRLARALAAPPLHWAWDGTWDTFARSLGMGPVQAEGVLHCLREAKAEAADLLSEPAQGGAAAPFAVLGRALAEGVADAHQAMLRHLQRHKPRNAAATYSRCLVRWHERTRKRLAERLTPEQARLLEQAATTAFLELRIPEDPYQARMRAAVAGEMAVGRGTQAD